MSDAYRPIPPNELETLLMSYAEATDLAEDGQTKDGYRCLLGGRARAEEAVEMGEAWGEELLRRWNVALERYSEQYGIQLD